MRSILSLSFEHLLLFEATVLQYAHFTTAQNPSNGNLSSSCNGCVIHLEPRTLSYTRSVSEVVSSQSVTVIPYITIYDTGNVTQYSTYTVYNSASASTDGIARPPAPLTWETLGRTLTYPTTYLAYPQVSAGTSARTGTTCGRSLTPLTLQPSDQARLVFPSGSGGLPLAEITSSASSIVDSLQSIRPLIAPLQPSQCSHGYAALQTAATGTLGLSSAEAVTHTTVQYLTTQGPGVIVRRTGTAPPPEQQTTPPANGGQGGNNNQPTITMGGSTYTGQPGGAWNIGGQTLTAGGPAQTIGGTTISVAEGGSVVINGQTTSVGTPTQSGPVQASTAGADVQIPGSPMTWFAGSAIGALGAVVGIFL